MCKFSMESHFFPQTVNLTNTHRMREILKWQHSFFISFLTIFVVCSHSRWSSSFASIVCIVYIIRHYAVCFSIIPHTCARINFDTYIQCVYVFMRVFISWCGFSLVSSLPSNSVLFTYMCVCIVHSIIIFSKHWSIEQQQWWCECACACACNSTFAVAIVFAFLHSLFFMGLFYLT